MEKIRLKEHLEDLSKKRKINSVREGLWLFDGNNYTTVEEEDQDPTILK